MTADVPPPRPAEFRARPDDSMRVDVAAVLAQIGKAGMQVIDARAAERYRGETETIDPVAGHIPGAFLRFWKQNINPDGTFKSAETLRGEFSQLLGNRAPAEVVHQCGSGVTACNNLLAMELAGLAGTKLYVGSWSEWCADPARPVATGGAP